MLKLKNKQLLFNFDDSSMKIFLKFCYFSFFLLLLSCGADTSTKTTNTKKTPTKTEIKTTVISTIGEIAQVAQFRLRFQFRFQLQNTHCYMISYLRQAGSSLVPHFVLYKGKDIVL